MLCTTGFLDANQFKFRWIRYFLTKCNSSLENVKSAGKILLELYKSRECFLGYFRYRPTSAFHYYFTCVNRYWLWNTADSIRFSPLRCIHLHFPRYSEPKNINSIKYDINVTFS